MANDCLDDSGEDEPEITEADFARRLSVSEPVPRGWGMRNPL
ncbi:MAG: hypothetical protein ACLTW9_13130 [Enterocloster sp.]